jgi:hypothetical protein
MSYISRLIFLLSVIHKIDFRGFIEKEIFFFFSSLSRVSHIRWFYGNLCFILVRYLDVYSIFKSQLPTKEIIESLDVYTV